MDTNITRYEKAASDRESVAAFNFDSVAAGEVASANGNVRCESVAAFNFDSVAVGEVASAKLVLRVGDYPRCD